MATETIRIKPEDGEEFLIEVDPAIRSIMVDRDRRSDLGMDLVQEDLGPAVVDRFLRTEEIDDDGHAIFRSG